MGGPEQRDDDAPPTGTSVVAVAAGEVEHARDRRNRVLAAFLLSCRSEHTRRAYAGDVTDFFDWCDEVGVEVFAVRRVHLDGYVTALAAPRPRTGRPAAASTVARRLAALAGFYDYAVDDGLIASSPVTRVRRPRVESDSPSTGLDRDEQRALLAAAQADGPRATALVTLLLHNGLRIDEALSRDVEHLQTERGHRVLRLHRKGGRAATAALAAPTARALDAYLDGRDAGPIFITRSGRRMDGPAAWRLIRRLARTAGLASADRIGPHSLRHTFVTTALDAKVELRDVQDAAGHADPRTTRRYDNSWELHQTSEELQVAC
ncbi:tyrosine-type recombinase/integrase [Pseudonocardia benzenivorans]|uniref:Tyrosine-type recombinase/integrase n=1 Tax=Pseudonocardia benzenivorans TaxID=228005 RepID=A0ABW3VEY2_9PSEU